MSSWFSTLPTTARGESFEAEGFEVHRHEVIRNSVNRMLERWLRFPACFEEWLVVAGVQHFASTVAAHRAEKDEFLLQRPSQRAGIRFIPHQLLETPYTRRQLTRSAVVSRRT